MQLLVAPTSERLGKSLDKGEKITAKQRFKNPLERSKVLLGVTPRALCSSWGCSEVFLPGHCLTHTKEQTRGGCGAARGWGPWLHWGNHCGLATAVRIRSQQLEAGAGSLFRVKKH